MAGVSIYVYTALGVFSANVNPAFSWILQTIRLALVLLINILLKGEMTLKHYSPLLLYVSFIVVLLFIHA